MREPLVDSTEDDTPTNIDLQLLGYQVKLTSEWRSQHLPERLDSGIPQRFWIVIKKLGWWGACYLEAVCALPIREQAGTRASAMNEVPIPTILSSKTVGRVNMNTRVELPALDGSHPLAFLAALGTLRVLDIQFPNSNIKMSWSMTRGAWRPSLAGNGSDFDRDAIVAKLDEYLRNAPQVELLKSIGPDLTVSGASFVASALTRGKTWMTADQQYVG